MKMLCHMGTIYFRRVVSMAQILAFIKDSISTHFIPFFFMNSEYAIYLAMYSNIAKSVIQ